MATFRQRRGPVGQKVWHVQVRRRGWPPQTATFDKKSDAEGWAFQVESEMKKGVFISRSEAETTTLREALERYAREVTPEKKPSSRAREVNRIRVLGAMPIALRPLAGIHGSDISAFITELQGLGLGPNTVRLDLALISHLFTTARGRWGMESLRNPVLRGHRPKIPGGRTRRLEKGEEARLLGVASPAFAAVLRFALATAMRRSEIAGLRWERVDLKRRSAHLSLTKNGTARTVPLSREAIAVLESVPRRLDGSVFGMTEDAITRAMSVACRTAGITGLTFHDLRHEAISRLFENTDLDAMEIARISGHRTLSMLSRYTHLRAHHLAERMDGTPRGRGA